MKHVKHLLVVSLLVLSIAIGFAFVDDAANPRSASAADCNAVFLSMYDSFPGPDLSGIIVFTVGVTASSAQVEEVVITADDEEIGMAVSDTASPYSWIMHMPANLLDDGEIEFAAEVYFDDGDECVSDSELEFVAPLNEGDFQLSVLPNQVTVPVNTTFPLSAGITTPGTTNNFSEYAIYDWSVEGLGSVESTPFRDAQFFAGPTAGSGVINVSATFGFVTEERDILAEVTPGGTVPQPPVTDDTDEDETDRGDSGGQGPDDDGVEDDDSSSSTQQIRVRTIENDPLIRNCLEGATGEEGYAEIVAGERRPTGEELRSARACFARTSFVIPQDFAPVDPDRIADLPTTTVGTTIDEIDETTRTGNGTDGLTPSEGEDKTLTFSGKADPFSNVYLYIFSEPLVLSVTADESGTWQYELDNPLEPGEHTAYVVVDRGNGVYERTDALSFVISPVEASEVNPTGLSLELDRSARATATPSNRSTASFLGAAGAVLLVAVAATFFVLNRKKSKGAFSEALSSPDGGLSGEAVFATPETPKSAKPQDEKKSTKEKLK